MPIVRSDFVVGTGFGAVLPAGAQSGFPWVPSSAADPGVPTAPEAGVIPLVVVGTTTKTLKMFDGANWIPVVAMIPGPDGGGWYLTTPGSFGGNDLQTGVDDAILIGNNDSGAFDGGEAVEMPRIRTSGKIYADDTIRSGVGFKVGVVDGTVYTGRTDTIVISGTTLTFVGGILVPNP